MDDRRRTVAAITLIIVCFSIVALIGLVFLTRKNPVVSPIPEEGAIRIIFVSPTTTPTTALNPSTTDTPTPTSKPKVLVTPKPTSVATASPTPTNSSSPSASPKP